MASSIRTDHHAGKVRHAVAVLVVLVVAVLVAAAVSDAHHRIAEQEAASVRQAVIDTAMQCCAIEGAYPSSLSYLEENYGLTVDQEDYIIDYVAFASNVVPAVTVIPK